MGEHTRASAPVEEVYDYLQHDTLKLVAWLAVGTAWLAIAVFFRPWSYRASLVWLPAPALLLVAGFAVIGLQDRHFRAATMVFVAALLLADGILLRAFRNPEVLYSVALVVSLTAHLVGPTYAAVATGGALALASWGLAEGLAPLSLAGPVVMALLTLVVARLSSHYLYANLGWAWESHRRSLEKAEEARQDRARLASVSKSLDEAYERLRRANEILSEAWQVAEEAKRFKAQFAANISHELRTPLYIVVGFAEAMLHAPESYGVELPPPYRSDLVEVYNSSRHLLSLIDDVLDLSQIEAGRMGLVKETTDFGDVVREAVGMMDKLIRRKGLFLALQIEEHLPPLELDRTRIRQVLLNLLNNAVRYTEKGGISVGVRLEDTELVVTVADTGPGISQEQLERIFQSFYQVDAGANRRHGGIGLGLAISRYFISMHGGRIWAESELGAGSHFHFALPIQREVQRRNPPAPPLYREAWSLPHTGQREVLLLHSDSTTAAILERHLDETQIVSAPDLTTAEELASARHPMAIITADSAVVSELGGRDDEGPETGPARIPLITCDLPSGLLSAVALGVQGYLVKPVTRQRLLTTIRECAPQARRILVVDDDPRVVRLLTRMLLSSADQYAILRAFDGNEALTAIREHEPDLVLLDLYMPHVDGFAVLERMAAEPAMADVPVVVVSAKGLPEDGVLRLHGPITIRQPGGFTLAELFRYLQSLLDASVPSLPAG